MQIILHCGVYSTDITQLLQALRANCGEHLPYNTHVSSPADTRIALRRLLNAGRRGNLPDNARDVILELSGAAQGTERLILTNPGMLGTHQEFISDDGFFPNSVEYVDVLRTIFEPDDVAISFAMRNPATLLSSIINAADDQNLIAAVTEVDPAHLLWSELIDRLSEACGDINLTVWFNEDGPLIWRNLITTMLDIPEGKPVHKEHSLLASLLDNDSMAKFRAYIAKHPGMIEKQERRVIAAFLEKFAKPEQLQEDVNVPGWTQDYVDEVTQRYEAEQQTIAGMNNVRLISF